MNWAAYAIGAFYLFGGLLALRAARTSVFLDRALSQITGERTPLADRLQAAYGVSIGVLMLAGGGALLLRSRAASAIFCAGLALQALYLLWAARALPPKSPEEVKGRRGGVNALVLYGAVTGLVIWMHLQGILG